jgi:hypothetical protein
MRAGEGRLIWQLFLMVREVLPPTVDNVARMNDWAQHFHELEADDVPLPSPQPAPPPAPRVEPENDDEDDEPRRKPKPKKRGKR